MSKMQFTIRDLLFWTFIVAGLASFISRIARTTPDLQPRPLIFVDENGNPAPEIDPKTGKIKRPRGGAGTAGPNVAGIEAGSP